jgi:hypothetical protein
MTARRASPDGANRSSSQGIDEELSSADFHFVLLLICVCPNYTIFRGMRLAYACGLYEMWYTFSVPPGTVIRGQ